MLSIYYFQEVLSKCLEHISRKSAIVPKSMVSEKEWQQKTAVRYWHAAVQKAEQNFLTNNGILKLSRRGNFSRLDGIPAFLVYKVLQLSFDSGN